MRIRPLICHSRCPIVFARACSIAAPFRPRRRSAGSGASAQPAGFNRTGSACICSKLTCAANSFHRFLIWFSSLPWRSTAPPAAPGPAMGPHPGRWLHRTDCPMPQPARCWPAHPASSSTRCSHSPGRKRTAATAGHWSAATAPPLRSAVRSVCAAARCAQSQHGAFALQPAPIASDPRNRSRSWAAPRSPRASTPESGTRSPPPLASWPPPHPGSPSALQASEEVQRQAARFATEAHGRSALPDADATAGRDILTRHDSLRLPRQRFQ